MGKILGKFKKASLEPKKYYFGALPNALRTNFERLADESGEDKTLVQDLLLQGENLSRVFAQLRQDEQNFLTRYREETFHKYTKQGDWLSSAENHQVLVQPSEHLYTKAEVGVEPRKAYYYVCYYCDSPNCYGKSSCTQPLKTFTPLRALAQAAKTPYPQASSKKGWSRKAGLLAKAYPDENVDGLFSYYYVWERPDAMHHVVRAAQPLCEAQDKLTRKADELFPLTQERLTQLSQYRLLSAQDQVQVSETLASSLAYLDSSPYQEALIESTTLTQALTSGIAKASR